MATNNWWYTVIWGYMTPDGQIVEEKQYNPTVGYTIAPPTINNRNGNKDRFTPAETFKFTADGYYNQWDTALWDAYSALRKSSDAYANTAKQMNDFYSALWNDTLRRETALAWMKTWVANKLFQDMSDTKDYIMNVFWPDWSLTKELNKYYSDLGNYLATDAGRQAAKITAQWMHSWASLWAIRAQQNEAYNESFQRYLQAKEQELNAKQTIASNLINYMSTLRKEYWDTTNTYIISQYQRANDLLESLATNIAKSNAELLTARLVKQTSGGKSSSSSNWNNMSNMFMTALFAKMLWEDVDLSKYLKNSDDPDEENPFVTENNP